ncbi:NAD(P)/FAD-dependent oxidoreductase [Thalassotalea nanhaiensis]|uniref:Pyridine nucleotide-disulfide oxidoreductase domain-containing protein 2 n=1 Tax=Thalassotalea nanhaiensis TaxID=3065648 RepID=A0ABY9TJ99_9GAMM|nr:NAD(P)/FAD-dependent oxidoreductase [Colwelliaceae bacterium SQ345]
MSQNYDAIVIGAGHNGLTNAAYLAKAGMKVVVLEKNDYIGGAAVSRELHKGWIYSNCSYVCSLLRQSIHRDLELSKHGLLIVPYGGTISFGADGDYIAAFPCDSLNYKEIERHSVRDAAAYHRYETDLLRYAKLIRHFLLRTPADPSSLKPRDLKELLHMGKKFGELGEEQIYEFMRFLTMSAADFLDEYFENDLLKSSLASASIIGTALGVYSPGTAYVLLHHVMGDVDGAVGAWGLARGGMGAISAAIANALEESGGEIQTGKGVKQILVKNNKAIGVLLDNGEVINANIIISNLDPKRTFTKIMAQQDIPADLYKKAKNFKIRGSSGKLNIALTGMPKFTGLPDDHWLETGSFAFCGSLEEMERAYDDWKHQRFSSNPFIEMTQSSCWDPTIAAPGHYFVSCFTQYCPADIEGGWTAEKRDAFAESVLDRIEQHSPNFRSLIAHMEVRTPFEIENEVGLTEGNIFQGELTLDQLMFNRPFPGYAQYRGPVKGMYMSGSGSHPGGGVSSACGANSAREILMDLNRLNKDGKPVVPEDDDDE